MRPSKIKPVSRDPGSRAGFAFTLIILSALTLGAETAPWSNDWEKIRVMFGDAPSVSLVGNWTITRASMLDESGATLSAPDALRGDLAFFPGMKVELSFTRGPATLKAKGTYSAHGDTVYLHRMEPVVGDRRSVPPEVTMELTWTGENTVIAEVEHSEVIYLQRSGGSAPMHLIEGD